MEERRNICSHYHFTTNIITCSLQQWKRVLSLSETLYCQPDWGREKSLRKFHRWLSLLKTDTLVGAICNASEEELSGGWGELSGGQVGKALHCYWPGGPLYPWHRVLQERVIQGSRGVLMSFWCSHCEHRRSNSCCLPCLASWKVPSLWDCCKLKDSRCQFLPKWSTSDNIA